ncbi:winged helix-turn-helix transcriptional regulator [Actinoplanes sp. NPDC000266]
MDKLTIGSPARGTSTGRPLMVLFDALGRRGSLRLLWELREGRSLTFRSLITACESNPGALNTRLKELRELGLISHDGNGYHLTELGTGLTEALAPLNSWTVKWAKSLEAPVP